MVECNSPACKAELKKALDDLSENLYGEGPDGDKGVYGVLKQKVSYKQVKWIVGLLVAAAVFYAGLTVNHEGRISKLEPTVERNTGIIKELEVARHKEHQEILTAIKALKE